MGYKRFNSQMVHGGKVQAMKFSVRLWILWCFIIISLISILNIASSKKLLLFLALIGGMIFIQWTSSRKKAIIFSILLAAITPIIIATSFEKGVLVASIEQSDPLFEQGLRQGQIITSVNSQPTLSPEEYS